MTTNRVCRRLPLWQFLDYGHNLVFEDRLERGISFDKRGVKKFSGKNQLAPLTSELQFACKELLVLRDVVRRAVRKPRFQGNPVHTGCLPRSEQPAGKYALRNWSW